MRLTAKRITTRTIRSTLREHCKRYKPVLQNNEITLKNEMLFIGCPVRLIDVYGACGYMYYYDVHEIALKLAKFPNSSEQIAYINHVMKELTIFTLNNPSSKLRIDNIIEKFSPHECAHLPTLYISDNLKVVQHEITNIYKCHLSRLIGACMAQDVAHINSLAQELLSEYNSDGEFSLDKTWKYNGVISQLCESSMHNSMITSNWEKESMPKVDNDYCMITELIDCHYNENAEQCVNSKESSRKSTLTEEQQQQQQEGESIFTSSDTSALEKTKTLEQEANHICDESTAVAGAIRNGNGNMLNQIENKETVTDVFKNNFALALALAMNCKMPSLSVYTAKELVKMININLPDAITLFLDKMKLKDNHVAAFQSCATQLAIRLRKERKLLENQISITQKEMQCVSDSSSQESKDHYMFDNASIVSNTHHQSAQEINVNMSDHKSIKLVEQQKKMTLIDKNLFSCQRYNIDPWIVFTTDAKAILEWAKANASEQLSFPERALKLLSIIQQHRLLPGHLCVTTLSLYCMYDLQRKWWETFLTQSKNSKVTNVPEIKDERSCHAHNCTAALDKRTTVNTKPTNYLCSSAPDCVKIKECNIENEVCETVTQLALRDVQRNLIDTHQLWFYSELLRNNRVEVQSSFHAFIEECGECYLPWERPSTLEFTLTNELLASLHIPTRVDFNVVRCSGSMIASGKVLLSCDAANIENDIRTSANVFSTNFTITDTPTNNDAINSNTVPTKTRSLSLWEILRSLAPLSAYWCTLLDNFSHLFHVTVAPCSELRVHVNLPLEHECVTVARELYRQPAPFSAEEVEKRKVVSSTPTQFDKEEKINSQLVNSECKMKVSRTERETLNYNKENDCEELNVQNSAEIGNANKDRAPLISPKCAKYRRESKETSRYKAFLPLRVLYEDDDIFVLDKPSNIATCHHALSCTQMRSAMTDIVSLLLSSPEYSFLSTVPRQGKVHRLDYETSGCLLFAKNEVAYDMLRHQMGTSASFSHYSKVYLALCIVLEPSLSNIPLHGILTDHDENRILSKYRIIEFFADARVVLVECRLQQGKKHQLRRHLAAAGLPIAGDVEHGGAVCCQPFINRVALHARSLHFIHPHSGQPMCVSSPLPLDFNLALEALHHNYRNIDTDNNNGKNDISNYINKKESKQEY